MHYKTHTVRSQGDDQRFRIGSPIVTPWSFGEVKRTIDRHKHGTHTGLEHITVELRHGATVIGECDIHLHHNRRGLSVGTTTRLFTNEAGFKSLG